MNKNPLNKGVLTENSIGLGTVTRGMVEARANELAAIAGRVPPQPSAVDYEQAKREPPSDGSFPNAFYDLSLRELGYPFDV